MNFGLDASFSEEALRGTAQRRPRQRPRQPREPRHDDDRQLRGRRGAGPGAGGGRGHRPCARRSSAPVARREPGHGGVRVPARARRDLGVHRPREPLRRRHGPVGAGEGSGQARAPRDGALHARRVAPRASASCSTPSCPDAAAKIRGAVGAPAPSLADLGWGRLAARHPGHEAVGALPARRRQGAAIGGRPVPGRRPPRRRPRPARRRSPSTSSRKVDLRVAEVLAAEKVAEVQEAPQAHHRGRRARRAPSWRASPSTTSPPTSSGGRW